MALSIQELAGNAEKAAGNASTKPSMGITTCCQPYTLEIGIFFDGTFNNSAIDAEQAAKDEEWEQQLEQQEQDIEQARSTAKQAKHEYTQSKDKRGPAEHASASPQSSPGKSSPTNITKLHLLYPVTAITPITNGETQYARVYVLGVGAAKDAESPDDYSTLGGGTGLGKTGGLSRINEAREGIATILRFRKDCMPTAVRIDVFGFSRGAALARHFVNALQDGLPDYSQPTVTANEQVNAYGEVRWEKEATLLSDRGTTYYYGGKKHPKLENVEVRFVGLFDTVGSFGLGGNAYEWGFKLHLPDGCASTIYQLVAAHERRTNFRFTSVIPGGEEEYLAGVHADIGGGYARSEVIYLPMDVEKYSSSNVKRIERPGTPPSSEPLVTEAEAYNRLIDRAKAAGYVTKDGTLPQGWKFFASPLASAAFYQLTLARPKVTINSYPHVALHIMLNKAIAAQVPFKKNRAVADYPIPADLAHLEGAAQITLPLALWEKYIHVSATTNSWLEVPYAAMPRAQYGLKTGMQLDHPKARLGFPNAPDGARTLQPYPVTSGAGYDVESGATGRKVINW